jgi:hypothetical protein
MSSGIKQCCAFGRHCVIASQASQSRSLLAGARSRDDWTEIQESDCWGKCLIMKYGETTCCQRRPGRVDDEGNNLLLNSERGAGGVVVSKEEVAAGRKGSGGGHGGRPAGMRGLQCQPRKMVEYEYWQNK